MILAAQDPHRRYEVVEDNYICLVAPLPSQEKNEAEEKFDKSIPAPKYDAQHQVITAPRMEMMFTATIMRSQILRQSGDYEVYLATVMEQGETKFQDKQWWINGNQTKAEERSAFLYREFMIGKKLKHPNIQKYMYYVIDCDAKTKRYHYHILLENIPNLELKVFLTEQWGCLRDIAQIRHVAQQALQALRQIHRKKFIHSNFKTTNVTVNEETLDIKLVDLGVPCTFNRKKPDYLDKFLHKLRYMSPEEFEGKLSKKTDAWAFGCFVLKITTGLEPYEGVDEPVEICSYVMNLQISPLDYSLQKHMFYCTKIFNCKDLYNLLKRCFKFDYRKRPTFRRLDKYDPFFKSTDAQGAEPDVAGPPK